MIVACPTVGPGPQGISMRIRLDEIDIEAACPEGISLSSHDVAAVRGLLDRVAIIIVGSAVGPSPEGVPRGICLDQVDLLPVRPE